MDFSRALEDGGELPGVGARRFGQLKGDVGGPVAVVPVLRTLNAHLIRDIGCGKPDFTGGDGVLQAGGYGEGEFFWGHSSSLPVARSVAEFGARHDNRTRLPGGLPGVRRKDHSSQRQDHRVNHYADLHVVIGVSAADHPADQASLTPHPIVARETSR